MTNLVQFALNFDFVKPNDSLRDLSECNAGVRGGHVLGVDDCGLLEPLVRLRQLDRLAIGCLVAEFSKSLELETIFLLIFKILTCH
jgi:hypothetical protein